MKCIAVTDRTGDKCIFLPDDKQGMELALAILRLNPECHITVEDKPE